MILQDKFHILNKNPSGSFFHGQYKSDGKEVAIKRVSFSLMSESQKKKLTNEVNTLQQIKCNNIVKYHSYFLDKENADLYIFMEYCSGGSLQEFLEKKRKEKRLVEEKAIWKIFSQVVLAVDEIHTDRMGTILHRNICPKSIFLDLSNNVKLGNFSFSRRLDPSEKFAETFIPDTKYLSPEQFTSGIYTSETDIWQLGCLLYEMATLRQPFNNNPTNFTDLQPLSPTYSPELNRIISFCLKKQISKRPTIATLKSTPQINFLIRQYRLNENKKWVNEKELKLQKKQEQLESLEREIKMLELEIQGEKKVSTSKKIYEQHKESFMKSNASTIQDELNSYDKENLSININGQNPMNRPSSLRGLKLFKTSTLTSLKKSK